MRLLPAAACAAAAAAVNPAQKAVQLLTKLQRKLEKDSTAEASTYEKYACFCKHEAGSHKHDIELFGKRLARLDALMGQLDGQTADEVALIASATGEIQTLAGEVSDAREVREGEVATFQEEKASLEKAVSACERAIRTLKSGKREMNDDTKLSLIARELTALAAVASDAEATALVAAAGARQQPHKSTYKSNHILAKLRELLLTFKGRLRSHLQGGQEDKFAYEQAQHSRENLSANEAQRKGDSEQREGKLLEEHAEAQAEHDELTRAKAADESYLHELERECEDKATAFDERSRMRAKELSAIAEALAFLEQTAVAKYEANSKLVGAQLSARMRVSSAATATLGASLADAIDDDDDNVGAPVFAQLRRKHHSGHKRSSDPASSQRMSKFLLSQASRLHSHVLATLALNLRIDHFVKVRSMINDLITRLESQATDEQTQKEWCDTEVAASAGVRDAQQVVVEDQHAMILRARSARAEAELQISQLADELASLRHALSEAEQLRDMEKTQNEKTVLDAREGMDAVDSAARVLSRFYREAAAALVQRAGGPDKDGRHFLENSPDTFKTDEKYRGAQSAKGGIIGILRVISDDFEHTIETVEDDETAAASAHTTYVQTTGADIIAKEGAKASEAGKVSQADDDEMAAEDSLSTAQELRDNAIATLNGLKPSCTATGMTAEQRRARRKAEVEALKEALRLLDTMQ